MFTESQKSDELLSLLENTFYAIVRVDPEKDSCWFLKGVAREHSYRRFAYTRLLQASSKFVYSKYRSSVLYTLSAANLKKRAFTPDFTLNFAYATFNREKWVSVSFVCEPRSKNIYLLFRKCREYDLVLKDIVNLYVYDRCDYFIYLDAGTNSYVMFSGSSNGTPLPPQICNDYNTETVKYANLYVPPEDREMVIREMRLERVIEMLESKGSHSLYTGLLILCAATHARSWNTSTTTGNERRFCSGARTSRSSTTKKWSATPSCAKRSYGLRRIP